MAHSKLPTQLGSTEVVMLVGNTLSPKIQATLNVGERRFCVNVPLQVGLKDQRTKGPKEKPYIETLTPNLGPWGEGDSGDILQGLQGGGSEATLGQRLLRESQHPFTSFQLWPPVAFVHGLSASFSPGTPNSHLVTHVITGSQATLQNISDSRDLCHPAVILTISYMTTKNIKINRFLMILVNTGAL